MKTTFRVPGGRLRIQPGNSFRFSRCHHVWIWLLRAPWKIGDPSEVPQDVWKPGKLGQV